MKKLRNFWLISLFFSMIMLLAAGNFQSNSMPVPDGQGVVLIQEIPSVSGAIFDVPDFGQYQVERGVSVPLKFSTQGFLLRSQSTGETYLNCNSRFTASVLSMLTLKTLVHAKESPLTAGLIYASELNSNYRAREKI